MPENLELTIHLAREDIVALHMVMISSHLYAALDLAEDNAELTQVADDINRIINGLDSLVKQTHFGKALDEVV